jgi:hypothetical protein
MKKKTFPDPKGDRFMEFAKEELEHMQEADQVVKLYPECGDQTCINGEWLML